MNISNIVPKFVEKQYFDFGELNEEVTLLDLCNFVLENKETQQELASMSRTGIVQVDFHLNYTDLKTYTRINYGEVLRFEFGSHGTISKIEFPHGIIYSEGFKKIPLQKFRKKRPYKKYMRGLSGVMSEICLQRIIIKREPKHKLF